MGKRKKIWLGTQRIVSIRERPIQQCPGAEGVNRMKPILD